ncbi:MAG TPA: serine hydrolase domain-containing protein [Candidatus Acidoferrum sp.]|jgi:CubicO group peptidase (beta-lactamase class C family)
MRFLIRVGCLLVFSFAYSQIVSGQGNPDKIPAAVDEVFADVTKPGSPGCSVATARDGKLLYAKGYGLANIEQNVALTPESVFDIGSTSKQFSAASILLLEKQGKLSVNDDIRKYIPEIPDYGKKITILNLLNHTSGLRDYLVLFELAAVNTDSVTTDEEALALIARQKALNFDPGTEWLYSNSGFFLLSVIVKRASGQSLREFAAENIFQPLNMSHTLYRDSHTLLVPSRALAYDPIEKGTGYTFDVSYFEQTGDGAVHTSVGDLLKWDENFYTAQVGGKPLLAELQEPAKLNNGKTLSYAKGLSIGKYRGLNTVSHGGSWGGYRAELLRFPDQHFSVVCLCNRSDASPEQRAKQVADVYLASVLKEKEPKKDEDDEAETKTKREVPVATEELKKLTGDYWSDELGVAYRLRLTNDKLVLDKILLTGGIPRSSASAGKALVPVGKGAFQLTGAGVEIRFQFDAAGKPASFTLDAGRTKGMIFKRTSDLG